MTRLATESSIWAEEQKKDPLVWLCVEEDIVILSLSLFRYTYRTHDTYDSFPEETGIDVIGSFSSTLKYKGQTAI